VAQRGSDGGPVYRLVAGDEPSVATPRLDPTQQAVVDHPRGPLLVLAGPGTGKTTTIVEAVAARIESHPEWLNVLARRIGTQVSLQAEAGLAISAGHVHASFE
jgi:Tfp pilus assembly ATPase PilU